MADRFGEALTVSRSFHVTRRALARARQWYYREEQRKQERIDLLEEQIETKRRAKRLIRRERRDRAWEHPAGAVDVGTISINVRDEGRLVHYPASAEDIREVLARLPAGMADGVSEIRLCLGMEHQATTTAKREIKSNVDPYLGRAGWEVWPGVFSGVSLGAYHTGTNRIYLYGYVYEDPGIGPEVAELYLRFITLWALVHEVAHHEDFMVRMGRGRWRCDDVDKLERQARRVQSEQVQRCVASYLEERYPHACRILEDGVDWHGGVRMGLRELADDGPLTGERWFLASFFSVRQAFETLVADILLGESQRDSRLDFARELHYAEDYGRCLAILDRLLAIDAKDWEALTLKADTYVHMALYDEALEMVSVVLGAAGAYVKAWEIKLDVYKARQAWNEVKAAATRVLELAEADDRGARAGALRARAEAYVALGQSEGAEQDLAALDAVGSYGQRLAAQVRKIMDGKADT